MMKDVISSLLCYPLERETACLMTVTSSTSPLFVVLTLAITLPPGLITTRNGFRGNTPGVAVVACKIQDERVSWKTISETGGRKARKVDAYKKLVNYQDGKIRKTGR